MIRNFLFSLFFFTGIVFISLIFLPAILLPKKLVLFGGKIMGYWTSFCLQIFLSTKIIIKGKENIIENKKFFIAASHQSMFETFFLQTIFNSPVFILKRELLMIPIFGWYLKKIGSISIKRNKVSKENLGFFDDISEQINSSDRPLIIFPQGTRLPPKDRTPFKKGSKKINTILTISILKAIEPGLEKNIFLKSLESAIYSELDILG